MRFFINMKSHFLLYLVILFFQLTFTASIELPHIPKRNEIASLLNALPSFKHGREGELLPSINSTEDVTSSSLEKLSTTPSSLEKHVASSSSLEKLITSPSTVKKQLQSDEFEEEDLVEVEDAEDITTVKNSVVARKGVVEPKPSVHARKGVVEPTPSVHARKGVVDPTSSVHARKGVEMDDMKPAELVLNGTESTTSNYVRTDSTNDIPKPPHILPSTTTVAAKSKDLKSTTTLLPKIISWTLPPLNITHHLKKPTLAVDAVKSNYSSTTPVIVGLIFGLVLIICIATLAYKKMQDVWSRRHYDRMDFLIDGMYDL